MSEDLGQYLQPSPGVTADDPLILALAEDMTSGAADEVEKAVRLFEFVRDGIRYNPYVPFWELDFYLAKATLERGKGYCVQKSTLLTTLARAVGIPARLGFGDIANHLLPQGMWDYLGTNIMTYHCWSELFLKGAWRKATPSFETELCEERGWRLVEFDGLTDAMLPAKDINGRAHVDYVKYHFSSAEVPLAKILESWEKVYGAERLKAWREAMREQS